MTRTISNCCVYAILLAAFSSPIFAEPTPAEPIRNSGSPSHAETPRVDHGLGPPHLICSATLLSNCHCALDGKVLLLRFGEPALLFDPETNQFTPRQGRPIQGGCGDAEILLKNGRVLILGGVSETPPHMALGAVQTYDPVRDSFACVGGIDATTGACAQIMRPARGDFSATLLTSGRRAGHVLIAGGVMITSKRVNHDTLDRPELTTSTEFYDPLQRTFTAGPYMLEQRSGHSATLLVRGPRAGQVLIVGGRKKSDLEGGVERTAELYDPISDKFLRCGSMKINRADHIAVLVAAGPLAGDVLVAGGMGNNGPNGIQEKGGNFLDSAELFDSRSGVFSLTATMKSRRAGAAAVALPNGAVLVAGGVGAGAPYMLTDSAELYEPSAAGFVRTGEMHLLRAGALAVLLGNGKVLVVGGQSEGWSESFMQDSAEIYDPTTGSFAQVP